MSTIRLSLDITAEDFFLSQSVTYDDNILEIIKRISKDFNITEVLLHLNTDSGSYDIQLYQSSKPIGALLGKGVC